MLKYNLKKGLMVLMVCMFSLTVAQQLQAKPKMMGPKDGSKITMSKHDFDNTVEILKGAIEDQNLMVITEINAQKMLRMAGKKVNGMKQILYFHPRYMKRVMEANKMATIQIPLKIIVIEKPDKKVVLRYFMPSALLNQYEGEEEISKELDGLVAKIVKEVNK